MGLLDQLASGMESMLGSQHDGGSGSLIQIAASLLQDEQGGLRGLLEKFQAAGLGEHAASWVGTGENQPIDASQLSAALGHGTIGELANKFGLSSEQVSAGLAQVLPQLIDKATPHGTTEGSEVLIQKGLSLLNGLFGGSAQTA